ncbi:hypothetical protein pb186bvf_014042 [Paramecium bursaria]
MYQYVFWGISGLAGMIALYSFFLQIRCNTQSMFTIINLLFSIIITSIGCLISQFHCLLSQAIIFTGVTSIILWICFIQFLTQGSQKIYWTQAKIVMIAICYLLPTGMYMISYFLFTTKLIYQDYQFCAYTLVYQNIYYQVGQIIIYSGFQFGACIYMMIQSFKSLTFIERAKQRYKFLQNAFIEQQFMPSILTLLFMPVLFVANLNKFQETQYFSIASYLLMSFGLLVTVILFGINPTMQKIMTIRYLYQLRQQVQSKYQAQLMDGSGSSQSELMPSRESEMGSLQY